MSDPKHKALNPAAPAVSISIVVWIVGSVLTLLFVVGLFYLGSLRWRSSPTDSGGVAFGDTAEKATVRAMQQEAASVAAVELDHIQSRINETIRQADQLDRARTEWTALTERLFHDDDGRLIAANTDTVKAFLALERTVFAPASLAEDIRRRSNQLLQDIRAARADRTNAWTPGRPTLALIEPDEAAVALALTAYRDGIQNVLAMIETGRQAGPASTTLQEAIKTVDAEYARQQARAIAAARDAAAQTVADSLAKAEADKVLAQGDAQRLQLEAEAQQAREQGRVERLKILANDPSVQQKYTAVLDKGHVLITSTEYTGHFKWKSERALPASLSEVQKHGHVRTVENFAKLMCGIGNLAANDRRKRSDYPKTDEDWKRWEDMRREFTELAPIWVEMGLLSK